MNGSSIYFSENGDSSTLPDLFNPNKGIDIKGDKGDGISKVTINKETGDFDIFKDDGKTSWFDSAVNIKGPQGTAGRTIIPTLVDDSGNESASGTNIKFRELISSDEDDSGNIKLPDPIGIIPGIDPSTNN